MLILVSDSTTEQNIILLSGLQQRNSVLKQLTSKLPKAQNTKVVAHEIFFPEHIKLLKSDKKRKIYDQFRFCFNDRAIISFALGITVEKFNFDIANIKITEITKLKSHIT